MSCLAIITARGGSKGVPDKNLRLLDDRPLIAWSIETGLSCASIDRVMVTTDSPAIRKQALRYGAEAPFLRPAALATDTARQEDAILHAMDFYEANGDRFDFMCLLEPTTPLRSVRSLDRGFAVLADHPEAGAVFSVMPCDTPPEFCNRLAPDGTLAGFVADEAVHANRQELPTAYQLTAVVTISRWSVFRERQTFTHDRTRALPVDPIEGRDIDEPLDWFLVESLLDRGLTDADAVRSFVMSGCRLPEPAGTA